MLSGKQSGTINSKDINQSVFVPVTDELIFDNPELIDGPLVPYSAGMACHGWLSIEVNPDESVEQGAHASCATSPVTRNLKLVYSS